MQRGTVRETQSYFFALVFNCCWFLKAAVTRFGSTSHYVCQTACINWTFARFSSESKVFGIFCVDRSLEDGLNGRPLGWTSYRRKEKYGQEDLLILLVPSCPVVEVMSVFFTWLYDRLCCFDLLGFSADCCNQYPPTTKNPATMEVGAVLFIPLFLNDVTGGSCTLFV